MSETGPHLSRRKFMMVSSTAIAAPILENMAGKVVEAGAAEKPYDFVDQKTCDLVVLGGGGSGLVAAVRAVQLTGKKVIVLEKAHATGGAKFAGTNRTFASEPVGHMERLEHGQLMTDGAFGGVLVNPEMQAYRPNRSLIEGLYVAGDFASGRHINLGGINARC